MRRKPKGKSRDHLAAKPSHVKQLFWQAQEEGQASHRGNHAETRRVHTTEKADTKKSQKVPIAVVQRSVKICHAGRLDVWPVVGGMDAGAHYKLYKHNTGELPGKFPSISLKWNTSCNLKEKKSIHMHNRNTLDATWTSKGGNINQSPHTSLWTQVYLKQVNSRLLCEIGPSPSAPFHENVIRSAKRTSGRGK